MMGTTHLSHKTPHGWLYNAQCELCGATDARGSNALELPCSVAAPEAAGPVVTVHLYLKHDDRAVIRLIDDQGNCALEKDGYLPFFKGSCLGGDDTTLRIDNATGKIIGWVPLKLENRQE